MAEKSSSTWRQWGGEMRRLRRLAGKTQQDVADITLISRPQIGKLELGTRTPNQDTAATLDAVLATGGVLQQLWSEFSSSDNLPREWQDLVWLERAAAQIRAYQPSLVPGLLQTEAYARTVLRQRITGDDAMVEHLVETRIKRLSALASSTSVWFVVDEPAISRVVGSKEIMAEQIDHLLAMNGSRVRLSVIPHYAPQRPMTNGAFLLMTLSTGQTVAHSQHPLGQVVIDKAAEVGVLQRLYTDLQSEALSPSASAELLRKIRGTLT